MITSYSSCSLDLRLSLLCSCEFVSFQLQCFAKRQSLSAKKFHTAFQAMYQAFAQGWTEALSPGEGGGGHSHIKKAGRLYLSAEKTMTRDVFFQNWHLLRVRTNPSHAHETGAWQRFYSKVLTSTNVLFIWESPTGLNPIFRIAKSLAVLFAVNQ